MRQLAAAAVTGLLIAGPGWAECPPAPDHADALTGLIERVQAAPDERSARIISNEMWELWADAPDQRAQELLDEGMSRREAYDFKGAVVAFDALIAYCPDYAEGYNQRAFVNFIRQDYAAALPDLDELTAAMRAAHAAGRNVAAHCVSRVDLAFALAAWRAAGARPGDRVEHASVAPPEALAEIAALGQTVVSQPAMISERGAVYRREVDADDLPHLYRLRSFQVAGVPLALSSDAPYTDIDPWRAMAAAVTRRCADGEPLGPGEALSPERAYAAMAGRPSGPGRGDLRLRAGMRADLCLLDRDWAAARADLGCVRPRRAWRAGADNYHLNGVGHGAPACAP